MALPTRLRRKPTVRDPRGRHGLAALARARPGGTADRIAPRVPKSHERLLVRGARLLEHDAHQGAYLRARGGGDPVEWYWRVRRRDRPRARTGARCGWRCEWSREADAGDGRARRRRARGGGRRGAARTPVRLGVARLCRNSERGVREPARGARLMTEEVRSADEEGAG